MTKQQIIENLKLHEAEAYEIMLCREERQYNKMSTEQLDVALRANRSSETEWMTLNTILDTLEIKAYTIFERHELYLKGILHILSQKSIDAVNYINPKKS